MNIDKWIDKIYQEIDGLLLNGKFDEIDVILDNLNIDDFPTSILISYLTITLPIMKRSTSREHLFNRILDKFQSDPTTKDRIRRLLGGLGLEDYKSGQTWLTTYHIINS